jgi:hypothetical protein
MNNKKFYDLLLADQPFSGYTTSARNKLPHECAICDHEYINGLYLHSLGSYMAKQTALS